MTSHASTIVAKFIAALNERNISTAQGFLHDGATLTFPGGVTFTSIAEMAEWSKGRYQSAVSSYETIEEIPATKGVIVYARGCIDGVLNNGEPFTGVRMLDRFEIVGERITKKEAWSDMADFLRKNGAPRSPS